MPEAAIAPAPAAAPAAPATTTNTPAVAPSGPVGIDKLMSDFNEAVTPATPEAKLPETKPDPAKPDPKPTDKPPEKPTDPKAKPEDLWEKAPPKLKNQHFQLKRESEEKISSLEKRIKEIESKPKEAPGDAKALQQYQTRVKELEQQMAATDYRQSPEFKRQFIDRYNGEYTAALNEVKALQITVPGKEGEDPTTRPATENDFRRILNLSPGDQDEAISALFGKYSPRVFSRLLELQRIERAANDAVDEHAKGYEVKAAESKAAKEKEESDYNAAIEAANSELQSKYPNYFAADEKDPEASAALQKGYDFADFVVSKAATLTPQERAAYSAVLRGRAAAFLPTELKLKRANAKLESAEQELAKFRKSDPGGGDERSGEQVATKAGGISEMAGQFDK